MFYLPSDYTCSNKKTDLISRSRLAQLAKHTVCSRFVPGSYNNPGTIMVRISLQDFYFCKVHKY